MPAPRGRGWGGSQASQSQSQRSTASGRISTQPSIFDNSSTILSDDEATDSGPVTTNKRKRRVTKTRKVGNHTVTFTSSEGEPSADCQDPVSYHLDDVYMRRTYKIDGINYYRRDDIASRRERKNKFTSLIWQKDNNGKLRGFAIAHPAEPIILYYCCYCNGENGEKTKAPFSSIYPRYYPRSHSRTHSLGRQARRWCQW